MGESKLKKKLKTSKLEKSENVVFNESEIARMLTDIEAQAKLEGVPFGLCAADIKKAASVTHCPVLGTPLDYSRGLAFKGKFYKVLG